MSLRLNLGSGANKLTGFINIDLEESCKPDLVHDFTKQPLPYDDNSVDYIVFFHTIEHIQKRFHLYILSEIWRVLKPDAAFIVSYPEFSRCYENWLVNKNGQREFWEHTIYGRQLYPSDHHVCIMDSHEFSILLKAIGFTSLTVRPEPIETYNSFISCKKGKRTIVTHTDILALEMKNYVVQHV